MKKLFFFILQDKWLLFIILFYVIAIALNLPLRNSGFSDDFAYHHNVLNFLATHTVKLNEWGAVSFLFQLFWGVLFSILFGFSYATLHLSVITLFFFGIVAFYYLLKEFGIESAKAAFLSCILAISPQVYRYAFSFMTDVPYLSLLLIFLYFAVKAINTKKIPFTILAVIVGNLAFLTRQVGLFLLISLFFVFFIMALKKKIAFSHLLIVFITTSIVYFLYTYWLNFGNITIAQQKYLYDPLPLTLKALWPRGAGYYYFDQTGYTYTEVIDRMGKYIQYVIMYVTPVLFLLKIPRHVNIVKLIVKEKTSFLIGMCIMLFLYGYPFITGFKKFTSFATMFPSSDHFGGLIIGVTKNPDRHFIDTVWTIGFLILLPIWSVVIGKIITKSVYLFLEKKNYSKKRLLITMGFVSSVFVIKLTQYVLYYEHTHIQTNIILATTLISLLWSVCMIIVFFCFAFRIRKNFHAGVFPILLIMLMTFLYAIGLILSFWFWEEYNFPFLPVAFLALGLLVRSPFSYARAIVVILALLYVNNSYMNIYYQKSGRIWEREEKLVVQGKLDPRNSQLSVSEWAWLPYFYQEESFNKYLKMYNGDKSKVPLRSWEQPEYKPKWLK